ncbi:MAG: NADH:flavin oxidoreductase [Synergistaceae bacterium]|jgi:2,4-dienoyl-CoA reductase-like NADH-dependent reductase (Old Yellow Enzyme family)|nr:NADH:flavin oxidoreductase [Synergistaceae bacterium]
MKIFDHFTLGGLTVENRFVRSATWEGMATKEGAVTPELVRLMKTLAEGGAGILISSHAYVRRDGQAGERQLGIYDDSLIPGLRQMCKEVQASGAVIFAQLAHAGVNANGALSGEEPIGPSAMENGRGEKAREATLEDIARLKESFAEAARRALEAGFDGVQIHAAHCYCLSQFLSPWYNRRTDQYGNGIENRARLLTEVYRGVRKVVGEKYPVIAKINAEDFIEGGLTPPMMVETSYLMEKEGLDGMEISGGGGPVARYSSHRLADPQQPGETVYYESAAHLYKARVKNMPLILVGGIRSFETCQRLLDQGLADMIALSRPLICEPDLISRWASGDTRRSLCVSCEGCSKMAASDRGLRCVLGKK